MIMSVRPDLRSGAVYSRTKDSAIPFAEHSNEVGVAMTPVSDPLQALRGHDIVVTSIPASGVERPFLDAKHVDTGSLVLSPDLARGFKPESIAEFDFVGTDEKSQSLELIRAGKMHPITLFSDTLTHLSVNSSGSKHAPWWRSLFVFGGMGVCDAALVLFCVRRWVDIQSRDG